MKNRHLLIIMLALLAPLAMWGQKTLPYEYGFENGDLYGEGWTMGGSSISMGIASGTGHTGSCYFQFYGTGDQYQYLVSPELSETTNGLLVEFYYKNNMTSFPQTFQVGYSTTGNSINDFNYGDEVITASNKQWSLYSNSFPNDTKYISIRRNSASQYLYIDDFVFEEFSEYLTPKNLVLTSYTSSTATLDWSARLGQDHWDIYYTTSTTAPTSSTAPQVANTTTKPNTITGLDSDVTYYAYVRGNYNNGEHYSDWSNACTFEVGCNVPQNLYAQAAYDFAVLSWQSTGIETAWQVAYSITPNFDPNSVEPVPVTGYCYCQLDDLDPNTTYYARVCADCGDGYSDWTDEVGFTTSCLETTGLRAANVTATTAKLKWDADATATEWEISFSTTQGFDPDNGSIVTVDENPYTLTGLTVNTTYYACIRSKCSDTDHSAWSTPVSFTPTYALTVNDAENSVNSYVPFYGGSLGAYNTAKSQFIIPSTSLASIQYATVTKLTFYSDSEERDFGTTTFDVLVSELDGVTSISSFFDWDDMTSVYSGTVSVTGYKMEITLNTPYQYMGGDLLIGFNQTATGTSASCRWLGVSTEYYTSFGGYEVSYGSYYSGRLFLPEVSFTYVPGQAPTCPKPKNLAANAVTANSATLGWTNGGEETAWQMVISQDPDFNPDNYNPISVTSNPFTLTELTAETTYYAYVRADCGGGDVSAWSNKRSFTPSAMSSLTVNEGTTTSYYVPVDCFAVGSDSKAQFIIPSTSLTELTGRGITRMTYYCEQSAVNWGAAAFDVCLKETDATTFASTSLDWSNMQTGYSGNLTINEGMMVIQFAEPFVYQGGNLLIGFNQTVSGTYAVASWNGIYTSGNTAVYGQGSNSYNYDYQQFLPQVTFSYYSESCNAPTGFAATSVGITTATLDWTAGGSETAWEIVYSTNAQFNPDQATPVAVAEKPYVLGGLEPETTYYAYIRSNCASGYYSDWSSVCSFTPTFTAPTALTVQGVGANSATLAWTAGGDETTWQISYSTNASFNPDNGTLVNASENPLTLTGLTAETIYYACVRATSGNYHSDWSNVCAFIPTNCNTVTVADGSAMGDVPVPLAYVDQITQSQFIIPVASLGDAKYGTIKRLTFYCDEESWNGTNAWMYVTETDNTSISENSLLAHNNMTYVHWGKVLIQNHEMVVQFNNNDYQHHGGNLAILFDVNQGDVNTGRWYGVTTENTAMYNDGTSNNFVGFLPKMTISYIPASCAEPQNLVVSPAATSAMLQWSAGGSETAWQLQYKAGQGDWSDIITVSDVPSYSITGLSASTEYQVRIRSYCYDDLQGDWITESFTTCDILNITAGNTFMEDFTGFNSVGLPECWSYIQGSEYYYPAVTGGGDPYLVFEVYGSYGNVGNQYAILPGMSNISGLQMSFNANGTGDTFAIGVMEANGTFTPVKTLTSTEEEERHVVYFDPYIGNGTNIAIEFGVFDYARLEIDDIVVSPIPTCFMPSGLSVSEIGKTSAKLSWTPYGQETDWQVQYSTNGTSWTTVDVNDSDLANGAYQLTGLEASTLYQLRLRANCGGNDYSDWTNVVKFLTECDIYTDEALLEDFDEIDYDVTNSDHPLPLCWSYINASTHWENNRYPAIFESGLGDNFSQSFPGYLRFRIKGDEEYDPQDQYAILPEMPNVHDKQIKFSASGGEWGDGGVIVIGVMTDPTDASTFTSIRSVGPDGIGYSNYTVYFDAYPSGQAGYIAIKMPKTAGFTQVYVEDVAVTPAPSCRMPFNFRLVGDPTETTAQLTWVDNGMTLWELQYRAQFTDWTSVLVTTAPPCTLTDLIGNTYYEVRLRAVCDNGGEVVYSDWCDNIVEFGTECQSGYHTIPYYMDFDHVPPCWANTFNTFNGQSYPTVNSGLSDHTGGGSDLYFYMNTASYSGAYQMAVLPKMKDVNTLQMALYAKGDAGGPAVGLFFCDFEIGVLTDPEDASTYQMVAEISPDLRNYSQHIVSFANYTGGGEYIAIKKTSSKSYKSILYIDDIVVSERVNYTNIFTGGDYEGHYWDDASYWSKGTLPTMEDNVLIVGKAVIPSGCVAEANIVDYGTDGELLIKDGGQLKHNNANVAASVEKEIEGYGTASTGNYYLIASPMVGSLDAKTNQYFGYGDLMGLLDNEYDLYRFSTAYESEWRNYKKDLFTIDMTCGYLYANNDGVTLTYNGSLKPSNNNVEVGLLYQGGTDFAGYNLIGNPFPCNAYFADNRSFYRINPEGTALIEASGAIAPCEGVFVQATGEGQSAIFTRTASRGGSIALTLGKSDISRAVVDKDRARICFGEGQDLGKFALMASPDKLYIPVEGKDFAAVHVASSGELPLNFKASENGVYTISVNAENLKVNYLHLIDNLTGDDVDLLQTPSYTFNARHSDYASRFKVVFGVNENDNQNEDFAFISNGNIVVNGTGTLQIIDMLGRQLSTCQFSSDFRLPTSDFSKGVYVLRLINGDNVKTQKLIIK